MFMIIIPKFYFLLRNNERLIYLYKLIYWKHINLHGILVIQIDSENIYKLGQKGG